MDNITEMQERKSGGSWAIYNHALLSKRTVMGRDRQTDKQLQQHSLYKKGLRKVKVKEIGRNYFDTCAWRLISHHLLFTKAEPAGCTQWTITWALWKTYLIWTYICLFWLIVSPLTIPTSSNDSQNICNQVTSIKWVGRYFSSTTQPRSLLKYLFKAHVYLCDGNIIWGRI